MENTQNPLLTNFRLPGTTVRIPSRGLFYLNGELTPDVTDGELTIYPMTLQDDIVLRSIDKLFNGEAVTEVFSRCVPQVIFPKKLMSKDVDFLIMQLRRVSYGDEFEIKFKHDCPDAKEHSYVINIEKELMPKVKSADPIVIGATQNVKLHTGFTVSISPTRFENLIQLLQASEKDDYSEEERVQREVDAVCGVISSVTTPTGVVVTELKHIGDWLRKIPNSSVKQIVAAVEKVSDWGIDLNTTFKCADCGAIIPFEVPFNPISFFT